MRKIHIQRIRPCLSRKRLPQAALTLDLPRSIGIFLPLPLRRFFGKSCLIGLWAISSVARAFASHARGHRFKSCIAHHTRKPKCSKHLGLFFAPDRPSHNVFLTGSNPVLPTIPVSPSAKTLGLIFSRHRAQQCFLGLAGRPRPQEKACAAYDFIPIRSCRAACW